MKTLENFEELVKVVKKLRSPEGCPWDREQTHESIRHYLVEETYELIEAIEEKDSNLIQEELGDILLHVVMHSAIAEENASFRLEDVIKQISEKMIRRHPHVFGDVEVSSVEDVWKNWDAIKKEEKKSEDKAKSTTLLNAIPKHLPALLRAERLQKRASRSGFDWADVSGAWQKINEELSEINDAIEKQDSQKIHEEIGDLLFAVVNVARKLDIHAEEALQDGNKKFFNRFTYVEKETIKNNSTLENSTLEELDVLWNEAKAKGIS
jgi:tetrapyrrole methylase family protein / MazG family protein